jgi:hypothetical protein
MQTMDCLILQARMAEPLPPGPLRGKMFFVRWKEAHRYCAPAGSDCDHVAIIWATELKSFHDRLSTAIATSCYWGPIEPRYWRQLNAPRLEKHALAFATIQSLHPLLPKARAKWLLNKSRHLHCCSHTSDILGTAPCGCFWGSRGSSCSPTCLFTFLALLRFGRMC